ncbi:MAG: family 43 glycosylhydrolase [Muribaculaceae bacterium]|nr:family 43 glycosylhydrolase [Muribaculaceae bacterium]
MKILVYIAALCLIFLSGCSKKAETVSQQPTLLFEGAAYPNITFHNGKYYFTCQSPDINLYVADNIDSLATASPIVILNGAENGMMNIWSPEISRIGDKWYIYFEADDGNTDNHQLYVLENTEEDPLEGEWSLHGPIITNEEWNFGIHPSTFNIGERQFLLWSGWEHRRAETETQCIFIAEMENPWTLKSGRVLLSRPQYEWERQWITPYGTRSAYPIFVNENPEGFLSPDSSRVFIAYSASGIWTPYSIVGMLHADVNSDLLEPASWTKLPEPMSPVYDTNSDIVGISNISVITPTPDEPTLVLFQGHHLVDDQKYSDIYVQNVTWSPDGLPSFNF